MGSSDTALPEVLGGLWTKGLGLNSGVGVGIRVCD